MNRSHRDVSAPGDVSQRRKPVTIPNDTPIKICAQCCRKLPVTEEYFHPNPFGEYKISSLCRDCQSANKRRIPVISPEAKALQLLKGRAHGAIARSMKRGDFPRAHDFYCHYCHRRANVWHHHKGYDPDHWFSVIPVCHKCHAQIHHGSRWKEQERTR